MEARPIRRGRRDHDHDHGHDSHLAVLAVDHTAPSLPYLQLLKSPLTRRLPIAWDCSRLTLLLCPSGRKTPALLERRSRVAVAPFGQTPSSLVSEAMKLGALNLSETISGYPITKCEEWLSSLPSCWLFCLLPLSAPT